MGRTSRRAARACAAAGALLMLAGRADLASQAGSPVTPAQAPADHVSLSPRVPFAAGDRGNRAIPAGRRRRVPRREDCRSAGGRVEHAGRRDPSASGQHRHRGRRAARAPVQRRQPDRWRDRRGSGRTRDRPRGRIAGGDARPQRISEGARRAGGRVSLARRRRIPHHADRDGGQRRRRADDCALRLLGRRDAAAAGPSGSVIGRCAGSRMPDAGGRSRNGRRSAASAAGRRRRCFREATDDAFGRNSGVRDAVDAELDDWIARLDSTFMPGGMGHHGVSAGDADGDGLDDIYVSQPSGLPNRLFRNNGDGTFSDITESAGVGVLDSTSQSLFIDIDNDGDEDLVLVDARRAAAVHQRRQGATSRMFRMPSSSRSRCAAR